MAFFKWFAKIEALRAADRLRPARPLEPFDFSILKPKTRGARLKAAAVSFAFARVIPPLLRICQRVWPIPYIKPLNLAIVTRDEDVREVLSNSAAFGVPYGPEMTDLGGGTTFALGLDGAAHLRQNQIMRAVMRDPQKRYREDIDSVVAHTRAVAEALLDNGAGRIDAMTDYVTRIATETAARHFGVSVDDPDAFGQWTLAMSCLLFGDPSGDAVTRQLGLNAGARLRLAIDDSINRALRIYRRHEDFLKIDPTILGRLIAMQKAREAGSEAERITNEEIRAILLGMITGFVPTNTLAAGKMLRELLARPAVFARAREHARAQPPDRDAVKAIVLEAARFDSALAPGQWRVATCDAELASGTRRSRRIPQGTVVLVSTMTALRDPSKIPSPSEFCPHRADWGELMFGAGPHHCLGREMAVEQITEMFMVLLARDGLRRAPGREGKMEFTGAFPVRLDLVYDDFAATQSMFLIVAPVTKGVSKPELDERLAELGHGPDVRKDVRAAFDATNIVHFASISSIASERGLDLVVELSVDGTIDAAIGRLAEVAGPVLRDAFEYSDLGQSGDMAAFMRRHLVTLHGKPWGATGLDYFGTGEFSVRAIKRQEELARLSEKILASWLDGEAQKGSQPLRAVNYVRRILKQDRFHARSKSSGPLMGIALKEGMDTFAIKPSRTPLKLAEFTNATYAGAAKAFLLAPESRIVVWPVVALLVGLAYGLSRIVAPPVVVHILPIDWTEPRSWLGWGVEVDWTQLERAAWGWAGIVSGALVAAVLVIAALAGAAALWLRWHERRDSPDPHPASLERIEELGLQENYPGYAHNHFMAVGDLKPGLFRKLVHAFALWGIRMIIIFYYRPGFVVNMGTIHYARWWRLPGTGKSVFLSNYDGSWDSYLEDFITRARWGQTAAWSNWQGFPKTRLLIYKGAQDGDRFKRWVRTKQQIVPFWYSCFPHLTTDQIRNNALIHHGLARLRTDGEAREWLRCFGSMPRVENLIETDEVQSLVFRGFRDLKHSACLVCTLPQLEDGDLGSWVGKLQRIVTFGDWQVMGQEHDVPMLLQGLLNESGRAELPDLGETATFIALSAAGFRRFRGTAGEGRDLPASFPSAFKLGMAKRSRILGDDAPEKWRWSDSPDVTERAAEAVIIVYAETEEALQALIAVHADLLRDHHGEVEAITECAPAWPDQTEMIGHDHFGYRDGVAQPVISGTERFVRGAPARDLVEPGEFLLGYKSNQGYFPPSPLVRAEDDFSGILPVPSSRELSRFPNFGAERSSATPHDFGRNGTYIVIRELRQHVGDFNKFVADKAAEISGKVAANDEQIAYRHIAKLIGQEPSPEWIKAKVLGRWPDGRPLVGNPVRYDPGRDVRTGGEVPSTIRTATRRRAEHDNDFSYGIDDPQGFACPFGAHIRRANPRDSKQPGDADELVITNRHRLLRRGRSYDRGNDDRGLLFVALCGDLERQFEFVQQTWLNSPAFHGLVDEPDPIVGSGKAIAGGSASFTIPTPAGPVKLSGMRQFVTMQAGGYFFLPSRSALTYLKELSFRSARRPMARDRGTEGELMVDSALA